MDYQITCWILTRERLNYAKESIQSVLNSVESCLHKSKITVCISDNSKTPGVSEILCRYFPTVQLIYRGGELRQFEHFKIVANQTTTSHVVIFHDDDIMLPNYFTLVFELLEKNSDSSAFATNSLFIDEYGEKISRNMSVFSANRNSLPDLITISSAKDLVKRYLNQDHGGFPAFSTYCYSTLAVRKAVPDERTAGLYSDTTFLCDLIKYGSLSWSPVAGAHIRMHQASESGVSSVRDYKLFLSWIRKNPKLDVSSIDYNIYRLLRLRYFLKSRNRTRGKYWYRCITALLTLSIYSVTLRRKIFNRLIIS